MRPGIHPSQNSAASRADRGVAPQYQNGAGPPTGFGSIAGADLAEDLGVRADEFDPAPVTPPDCLELVIESTGAEAQDDARSEQLSHRAEHRRGDERVPKRDQRTGPELDPGVNEGTLGNWVNADRRRRDGGDGQLSEDERAELARLRKENAELAMDRVLKRSVALWVLSRYRDNTHYAEDWIMPSWRVDA